MIRDPVVVVMVVIVKDLTVLSSEYFVNPFRF